MPILELNVADQYLRASADTPLLDIYAALPLGLYPPFAPAELPGGLGGLVSRGGFGQNFFFAGEVLGVTFRTPGGKRVIAGGQVVKNVQGYDLTRPFVGSFGALGQALDITLRLRPGVTARQSSCAGSLDALGHTRARFVWEAQGQLHVMHFGHEREVNSVLASVGGSIGEPVTADYRSLLASGMGVGEGGPLRDLRFGWVNATTAPEMPPLFGKLVRALQ